MPMMLAKGQASEFYKQLTKTRLSPSGKIYQYFETSFKTDYDDDSGKENLIIHVIFIF